MADMIEKAARAQYEHYMEGLIGCCEPSWSDLPDSHKLRMVSSFAKGLEALRDPSEAMVDAGVTAPFGGTMGSRVTNSYQAMIDEILRGEHEG